MNWRCLMTLVRDLVAKHGILVPLACAIALPFAILWVWFFPQETKPQRTAGDG